MLKIENENGSICVTSESVAALVGILAMECYGIVGMASKSQLKDGLAEILGKENLSRGIVVRLEEGEVSIDLHVIAEHGIKIAEAARSMQNQVKYQLEESLGVAVKDINVFVQGIRTKS